jgi:hypothetical protein
VQESFKAGGHIKRYMDTWSFQELELCRQRLHPGMSADDVTKRFDRWGGSVRYVLEKLDEEDQKSLQNAIDSCTAASIDRLVGASSADAEASNRILHLRVRPETAYTETYMDWASPWVAEQIAYKLWRDERGALVTFLGAAAGLGELGSVRGHLWEGLCHARLAAGGSFRCRDLQSRGSDPVALELQPAHTRKAFDDWQSIQSCSTGTYCRPRQKNTAAVDAALQPDALFQITVGSKHSINCAGLAAALAGMHQQEVVKLYFVVPTDRFSQFAEQPIQQGPGVQQLRQRVRQYALEIPFGTAPTGAAAPT